jgi:hypothetical protein
MQCRRAGDMTNDQRHVANMFQGLGRHDRLRHSLLSLALHSPCPTLEEIALLSPPQAQLIICQSYWQQHKHVVSFWHHSQPYLITSQLPCTVACGCGCIDIVVLHSSLPGPATLFCFLLNSAGVINLSVIILYNAVGGSGGQRWAAVVEGKLWKSWMPK